MRMAPYQRLLQVAMEYAGQVDFPKKVLMFTYPKAKLHEGWRLDQLAERTNAAMQLGFDVQLKTTDAALEIWYVKRPERPWQFR